MIPKGLACAVAVVGIPEFENAALASTDEERCSFEEGQ